MGCGVIATIRDTKETIKHNQNNFSSKKIESFSLINSKSDISVRKMSNRCHLRNISSIS